MKRRLVAAVAAIGLALSLAGCAPTYDGKATGCTVTNKEAVADGSQTRYRLYTDCGVFAVQDDVTLGQWNSADLYGQIKAGATYDFTAYGWRNGFFSTFPNVISAKEVTK